MILTQDNDLQVLLGEPLAARGSEPLVPYSNEILSFLSELSRALITDPGIREFPDVATFAYWCRSSNLKKLQADFNMNSEFRFGRGLAFHITPANVPINFAFSYAFGLLSGCSNIVRVPSRPFLQTSVVLSAIQKVLKASNFPNVEKMSCFVTYPQNAEITSEFSSMADARVIWGGDAAVQSIRQIPSGPRSIELAFSDRYSFAILDATSVVGSSSQEINDLVSGFFNDVFLFDQNACSSPRLVVWKGNSEDVTAAKQIFWRKVRQVVRERYQLEPINAMSKYTNLCSFAIENEWNVQFSAEDNFLYLLDVESFLPPMLDVKNTFGTFFELNVRDLVEVAEFVTNKFQTMSYFGLDREEIAQFLLNTRLNGISRVVPIGQALEIGVMWDGHDVIRTLSRLVEVR